MSTEKLKKFAIAVFSALFGAVVGDLYGVTSLYHSLYPEVDIACNGVDRRFELEDSLDEVYINLPVRCRVRNLGTSSFSIADIQPVLFRSTTEVTLSRGMEDIVIGYDLYRKDVLSPKNSLVPPHQLSERGIVDFDTYVMMPMAREKIPAIDNFTEQLDQCFVNSDGLRGSVGCFEDLVGVSFVNYLYEEAAFNAPHMGLTRTNGLGVKLVLHNDKAIVDEIDFRGYGSITMNTGVENGVPDSLTVDRIITKRELETSPVGQPQ